MESEVSSFSYFLCMCMSMNMSVYICVDVDVDVYVDVGVYPGKPQKQMALILQVIFRKPAQ